jgi:hypothetical protein
VWLDRRTFLRLGFPLALVGVAVVAAAAACGSAGDSFPIPEHVFVLAGQSNMLGRGQPISADETSDPHLLVWRKSKWKVAVDPLGDPKDSENGVGPGMTFGLHAIRTLAPDNVGLVQCAVSGTTISKWEPPHSVYTNCIDQVRAAGGHIDAILFFQGESDATNSGDAGQWAKRFAIVLKAFRADLGANVPMVFAQIGKLAGFKYQQTVRKQQAQAAAANRNVKMITTLDLPTASDGVHFTIASYRTIGARFSEAWSQLRARRLRRA